MSMSRRTRDWEGARCGDGQRSGGRKGKEEEEDLVFCSRYLWTFADIQGGGV